MKILTTKEIWKDRSNKYSEKRWVFVDDEVKELNKLRDDIKHCIPNESLNLFLYRFQIHINKLSQDKPKEE